ncbi:MAG: DUF5009 domain-containing protein [Planctomycetaceae bacterium]|nr:DUF5009 domain-containing protein [Planctomycetaceae bacterium]
MTYSIGKQPEPPQKLPVETEKPTARLTSLDAFRGFVMLLMASEGFHLARVWNRHQSEIVSSGQSQMLWETLAYQLSHVPWVGCALWDLIQPAFMFMVGVSMPFSYAKRARQGQHWFGRFLHAVIRSLVLILLGVFLYSVGDPMTHFKLVNVLTQIGLGYLFVYLLVGRGQVVQVIAILFILGGYGYWFYNYTIPEPERIDLYAYLEEEGYDPEEEVEIFDDEYSAHWNKHTNAAAGFDRKWLNKPPRFEEEFRGKKFWVNTGGYTTLNFIPSIATMIFGLIAGQLLIGTETKRRKCRMLFGWGFLLLVAGFLMDTHIWPMDTGDWGWTVCPIVKRIWTPTWAIFSAGWVFLMMAVFFLIFDILNVKRLGFPLVVVGMNSIAFYLMASLMHGFIARNLETHMTTIDKVFQTSLIPIFFSEKNVYAPINESILVLFTMWLIALWMYRHKFFIRV